MQTELHVFTNSTSTAPDTKIIKATYQSFKNTFGGLPVTVWFDKNPNTLKARDYRRNLEKIFPVIKPMNSMSDGYINAIIQSEAKYLFMLEHDWEFITGNIAHTLDEILKIMKADNIHQFRFNKRDNRPAGWDVEMDEVPGDLPYCRTNNLSNNPHIVDRKKYLEFIRDGWIRRMKGSKGIEEILGANPDAWSALYGCYGHPATIKHLDGRKSQSRQAAPLGVNLFKV